jgi:Phage tail lysozyme
MTSNSKPKKVGNPNATTDFPNYSSEVSNGYYLNNLVSSARYLIGNGYNANAAAGIAGDMAGESSGWPEAVGSGGAGLIGWTPPSSASPNYPIVTGNPQNDFDNQLQDVLQYNQNQGSAALSELQSSHSPAAAGRTYSRVFERPAVLYSDTRPGVASYVYDKIKNIPTTGNLTDPSGNTVTATDTSFLSGATSFLGDLGSADFWERAGLVAFGAILVIVGIIILAMPALGSAASTTRAIRSISGSSFSRSSSGGPTPEESADRQRRLSLAEQNTAIGSQKVAVAQRANEIKSRRLALQENQERRKASRHKSGNEPNPAPQHT